MKTLTAVARKLLALIFVLVRDKREYELKHAAVKKMEEIFEEG